MNTALKILAWGVGCLVWGAMTFGMGLYLTFPSEAGLERLSYEVAERSRDEFALSASSLAPWGLGVMADDVVVYRVKHGRRTKDMDKPPLERTPFLEFERLSVAASPLAFLFGDQGASFSAEFHDGTVDGSYSASETRTELSLHVADIDLGQIPYESVEAVLRLVGKLNVDVDLDLNTEDVKKSTGNVKIAFDGFGLAAGSEVGGFQLPEVLFSEARVELECKEGKLEVTYGEFKSDVVSASLSGDIQLNKRLSRSRNRLNLAFSLPDDLDKLAQMSPDLKRARDSEGRYNAGISGTVFEWAFRLSRTSGKGKASVLDNGDRERPVMGVDRPRGLDGPSGLGASSEDMSDEERRKAREERIRERRERLRQRREEAAKKRGENPEGVEQVDGDKLDRFPEDMPEPDGPDLPPAMDDEPPPYEEGNEEP